MATPADRHEISVPHINSDDAAAHIPTSDLITILNAVAAPTIVLRPDLKLVWFNEAAKLLRFSPSDIGRASRDVPVLRSAPRLEEQCGQVIGSGMESWADFREEHKQFVIRISPYPKDDGQIGGIVLTFTNVTALRASVEQVIYERECTKAILNAVADPLV